MSEQPLKLTKELAVHIGPAFYERKPDGLFECTPVPVFRDNLSTLAALPPMPSSSSSSSPSSSSLSKPASDSARRFSSTAFTVAPQPDGSFFLSPLQERQCAAPAAAGSIHDAPMERCANWTHHLPFCEQHTRQLLRLEIKPSTLPEAGNGLFAYCEDLADRSAPVFAKGAVVCEYHGEIMEWTDYRIRYGAHLDPTDKLWFTPYAMAYKERIIDAAVVRGVMGSCNDATKSGRVEAMDDAMNIGKGNETARACPLVALRDIYHGDELFVHYGSLWWDAFPADRSAQMPQRPKPLWDVFEGEVLVSRVLPAAAPVLSTKRPASNAPSTRPTVKRLQHKKRV